MIAHRARWWLPLVALGALCAGEWLRAAEAPWAWAGAAALLLAAGTVRPAGRPAHQALAGLLVLLGVVLPFSQRRLDRIERHWPAHREELVTDAGRRVAADLHAAFLLVETLARDGALAAGRSRADAFAALNGALRRTGLDAGVAILEHDGTPWAWAGHHLVLPRADGDSISAAWSQFYVVLESRRHSARGRTVVASVPVWSDPAAPVGAASVAARFRAATQVELDVVPVADAPDDDDVFDYCEPTTAGPRCLFSVIPRPPGQADERALALNRLGQLVGVLLVLVLALGVVAAPSAGARWLLVLLPLWVAVRAPLGPLLGLAALFSPATYFFRNAVPLSGSAGLLALTGAAATLVTVRLWRAGAPRRGWRLVTGLAVLAVTPFLVSDLSRGIQAPPTETPRGLWLTWQLALFLAGAALLLASAALVGGRRRDGPPSRWPWVGAVLTMVAAATGLLLWQPPAAWPGWMALLWVPTLLVVAFPLTRAQAIGAVGIAAGSLAALLTWNAELHDRALAAQREVTRLAEATDPVALALADQFASEASTAPPPRGAVDLYLLWRRSLLAAQGYPARLALWDSVQGWHAEVALDSLAVDRRVVDSLVREHRGPSIVPLRAPPGLHHLVLAPNGGATIVALIGPATGLVASGRLGRLLEPDVSPSPPYRLALVPADPGTNIDGAFRWTRDEWLAVARHPLSRGDRASEVLVQLPLGTPGALLLRGAVVLLLNVLLLALLAGVARALDDGVVVPRPGAALRGSFRGRLAVTLGVFFAVPAVALAAWGFSQLRGEARRTADVLVRHRLADALHASGDLSSLGGDTTMAVLREVGDRVDTHLGFYEGGRLRAATTGVLAELGVLPPLMDDAAFVRIALQGGIDVIRDGPARVPAERIGYRLVSPGTPSRVGVLALPSRVGELPGAARDDLALVLLLALSAGLAAALLAARAAAGTLAEPVSALQRAALALGRGEGDAPPSGTPPPSEFEPVFHAFRQMAADVRAGREALEAARRRTERVLATVPAGVVALDDAGRVLLANAMAEAMLAAPLRPGAAFVASLRPEWQPLGAALADPGRSATTPESPLEVADGARRIAAQVAPMGGELGGVVIALADVTELSRAQRVLAWGEMARQVAHEIKNPLTPMRLGIQHLQRAWRDGREAYGVALDETTRRILGEIDRLDTVARAFSRFGAPAAEEQPLEAVDLAAAARDVAQLYGLAAGQGAVVEVVGVSSAPVLARRDEVKEVLVNLLENARQAGARRVAIAVREDGVAVHDDGRGIPAALQHRVFEPHFSTTSSGAGLGLSIVKRLVESWGGSIGLESAEGRGTTIVITCRPVG